MRSAEPQIIARLMCMGFCTVIIAPSRKGGDSLVIIRATHKVAALLANQFATMGLQPLAAHRTIQHRLIIGSPRRGLRLLRACL